MSFLIAVAAVWVVIIVLLYVTGRRSHARELIAPVPNLLLLFKGLLRDPQVSKGSKVWLWFAVAWLISPIDLIPEFIPVLGSLDDAVVAALVLGHVLRTTDRAMLAAHRRGVPATLDAIAHSRKHALLGPTVSA